MRSGPSFFDFYQDFLCVLGLLRSAPTGAGKFTAETQRTFFWGRQPLQPWVIPNWSSPKNPTPYTGGLQRRQRTQRDWRSCSCHGESSLRTPYGNNGASRANEPVETAQDSCDFISETLYKPGCRHGVLLRMPLMFLAQTPDGPKGCDARSTSFEICDGSLSK
jgi:hypothetical protein